jgi:wyosine [tRNA(Phe)-imidazoG37] synthetase (radical SAM superfamily)
VKAKFRNRLTDNRRDLAELAPLGAPFVLIVDPASQCNFKCRFCPTGDLELIKATGRYQGSMAFETFTKIIDDLQAFRDPVRVLRLYKEGEPLMNKRFAEMVAYARKSDKVLRIDTTTNGVLLIPKTSEKIIEAGIDQINISVNGVRDDQFVELVRTKVNFQKYVENIKYLYSIKGNCEIYIKAIQENLSEDDQKRFLDTFGNISDRIFFEHLFANWPGFDDDIIPKNAAIGHYGDEVVEKSVCPYIFYSTTINSDGSVSLCVQDWARKLVVGDVTKESVRDIWLGKRLDDHRVAHLNGCRKDDATCAQCQSPSFAAYDNLDDKAEDIKGRLLAADFYGG